MLDDEAQLALVYNGECYNFQALKDALTSSGETFTSSGDTQVVLRLLKREHVNALARLNAMFALGLWNESKKELLLARDRFGQKPLYYARSGRLLVFASEVRALLASGLVSPRIEIEAVISYLSLGAVQGPLTLVKDTFLLAKSGYLIVRDDGDLSRGTYWQVPEDKHPLPEPDLRRLFEDAVSRHFVSDVPVGAFLSGGIDSSAVCAAAVRRMKSSVVSLNVAFPDDPDYSEADRARQIAAALGTEHIEIPVSQSDCLSRVRKAVDSLDQPSIDGANTFMVSQAAHEAGLKVALSGLGGDELFGGYPSFGSVPSMSFWSRVAGPLKTPAGALVAVAGGGADRRIDRVGDLLKAPPDLLSTFLVRRRVFSSASIGELVPSCQRRWISGIPEERQQELLKLITAREPLDGVGLLEMDVYMTEMLLRDSDVMGMAHSLEIRLPFLDCEFAPAVLRQDARIRGQENGSKSFLKSMVRDWLPAEIGWPAKKGFQLPFQSWMQRALRHDIEQGIEALRSYQECFSAESAARLWRSFCRHPETVGWKRPWALFVLGRYLTGHGLRP